MRHPETWAGLAALGVLVILVAWLVVLAVAVGVTVAQLLRAVLP